MLVASAIAEVYRCPGENYDITRSVHLARLAVSYAKCRNCPHAPDAPVSPEASPAEPPLTAQIDGALFVPEGIRGRYLNDLTRGMAARIAGAMASCLWDDFARPAPVVAGTLRVPTAAHGVCRLPCAPSNVAESSVEPSPGMNDFFADLEPILPAEGFRLLAPGNPGPCVVIAYDERPSSPDIVTGVGQALRRMGCQVVDIGLATRPCLLYAVDHLRAVGGVHITGAHCDPGWTGLDFLSRGTIPCSSPGELDRIAARYHQGYSRPSRRPGNQRTFQAAVPYEASLWKHFHALRPLKIALACPSRTVRDLFVRIFRKLACRLVLVETPARIRSLLDPFDPDVERTARHVRETGADLGVLIEDDGEQCAFFDEQGRLIPPPLIAGRLAIDQSDGASAAGTPGMPKSAHQVCRPQSTREAVVLAMRQHQARFAADGTGRYWFAEAYPACDALLTLVHMLQSLSRSDEPFSEVVAKSGGN